MHSPDDLDCIPFCRRFPGWLLVLFLVGCHDAPRENPFDPELTPAVELSVALDEGTGRAMLEWTRYAGEVPFAEYRVLRNAAKSTEVDTLVAIPEVEVTTFADSTLAPGTAYEYRVAVVNGRGFEVESERQRVDGYALRAVQLLAAESDGIAGAIRLRWSRYRDAGFEEYRVERRVVGTDAVVRLATVTAEDDTAHVDGSAVAEVDYVYQVAVVAKGEELWSNPVEGRLTLTGVDVTSAAGDAGSASLAVKWNRYAGPRFAAYRVERREGELAAEVVVGRVEEVETTEFADAGLRGNTEYFYRVVVETDRGEEMVGGEMMGLFYQRVAEWPLEMEEGEYARLYWEEDRLVALVAGSEDIRLLFFDREGGLREMQTVLKNGFPSGSTAFKYTIKNWSPSRAVTMARGANSERLLSFVVPSSNLYGVFEISPDGNPVWREEKISIGELVPPADKEGRYRGGWELAVGTHVYSEDRVAATGFSSLEAGVDGEQVLTEGNFADPDQWDAMGPSVEFGDGRLSITTGFSEIFTNRISSSKSHQAAWGRFVFATRFASAMGEVILSVGPRELAYLNILTLNLDFDNQTIRMGHNTVAGATSDSLTSIPLLAGIPYRALFEAADDRFEISLAHPLAWSGPVGSGIRYADIVEVDGFLTIVVGTRPRVLDPYGSIQEPPVLPGQASEMRSWKQERNERIESWLGLCLPEQHEVWIGRTGQGGRFRWPFSSPLTTTIIGKGIGEDEGEFIFPLSMARGLDGRFVVLDAEGNYVTQFGREGSGPGEFNFGTVEDLVGSIAVDDEGALYVADVGNGRIQKFAP